jgi:STE24 endopeptidase
LIFLVPFYIAAVLTWTAVSVYLSFRQSGCVRRHRDTVPFDFAASISLDEHRKAADYTDARERLARIDAVMEAALSIAWVCGGINLLYGVLAAAVPPSLARGVAFLLAAGAVGGLLDLPFDIYRTFRLEKRFGFNRTTPLTFIVDKVKAAAITLAIAVPLLFLLLWVMRVSTGLWWLYAWFGLLALMLAAPAIYVRFIAPRFNRFEPLADVSLRERIERLLARSGFRSSGLFTMDASRRSTHGNAYFIGFGRNKRIILFDTLLQRSGAPEVEAVVAHELGHFKYRHVLFGLARGAAVLLAVLAMFGWLAKQPWLLPSFGIAYQDDALALFVCMLVASLAGPLAAPFGNWISRRNEYQADDYARRMVGVEPMVSALTRLARDNSSTLTPDHLYALVHYSHPPVPLRISRLREGVGSDARSEDRGKAGGAVPASAR